MVGAGLLALGWKATKLAGRSSGKRGQAPHLSLPPGRSTAIGAGLARAYAFQRRENQSGNFMFSGSFIRARPGDPACWVTARSVLLLYFLDRTARL